jgi:hypothetical protein
VLTDKYVILCEERGCWAAPIFSQQSLKRVGVIDLAMLLECPFEDTQQRWNVVFQGRDSPIVKHYPQIKNPCFVSCVNYALCSKVNNYS